MYMLYMCVCVYLFTCLFYAEKNTCKAGGIIPLNRWVRRNSEGSVPRTSRSWCEAGTPSSPVKVYGVLAAADMAV